MGPVEQAFSHSVIPILPVSVEATGTSLYESQKKIYPRSVSGVFTRWRWSMIFLTQLVFYGLPWLQWGQRQAVLFDLEARRFFIFNLVLYPQDFIYLAALLLISALSLFLFTAIAGRLWCGFACPQTVYSEIFLWIEQKIEGGRNARIRLDVAALSPAKLFKKWSKHAVWLGLSLWTGFTFVTYFTPAHELRLEIMNLRLASWEMFWLVFYGLATYGNAGFLREQVCKYMCPYARFQSAMLDSDTLIVSYDPLRGEPRGARARAADPKQLALGSCTDCTLCVQVCPTGIDIRNGLQYECISCGSCVDVCNGVMDKMNYARGLIRFSTPKGMLENWNGSQMLRRVLRPRVLAYALVLLLLSLGLLFNLAWRAPMKVDVVRDRGALVRVSIEGRLENVYRLQLMNATEQVQQYRLSVQGLPGLELISTHQFKVDAAQSRWVAARLSLAAGSAAQGSHPIQFVVRDETGSQVSEKSVFLIP